jgi:NADPH2:quinone reductase
MRNTRVVVTRYGGPEVLRVAKEECPEPNAGEVRVVVNASVEPPSSPCTSRAAGFSRGGNG